MHIDYTVHFWTLLSQLLALVGLITFLYKVYLAIRSVIEGIHLIVTQHREVYDWYTMQKEPKRPHPHLQINTGGM